jgi:uncharacterized protein
MNDETSISNDDSNKWAGGVHVAAFLLALFTSWCAGVGGMIAAFAVWVIKKDESAFIRRHAAEAFNFNFSMFIYALALGAFLIFAVLSGILTLGLAFLVTAPLGILALLFGFVLAIVWIWCTVQAAIAGFDGKDYRYPLTFRIMS